MTRGALHPTLARLIPAWLLALVVLLCQPARGGAPAKCRSVAPLQTAVATANPLIVAVDAFVVRAPQVGGDISGVAGTKWEVGVMLLNPQAVVQFYRKPLGEADVSDTHGVPTISNRSELACVFHLDGLSGSTDTVDITTPVSRVVSEQDPLQALPRFRHLFCAVPPAALRAALPLRLSLRRTMGGVGSSGAWELGPFEPCAAGMAPADASVELGLDVDALATPSQSRHHNSTSMSTSNISDLTMCVSPVFGLSTVDALFWQAVEHNIALGVQHFVVYDLDVFGGDHSSGNHSSSIVGPLMTRLLELGTVTLVPWGTMGARAGLVDTHYHFQELALNHCLQKYGRNGGSRYVGFYDLDEFIVLSGGGSDAGEGESNGEGGGRGALVDLLDEYAAGSPAAAEFWLAETKFLKPRSKGKAPRESNPEPPRRSPPPPPPIANVTYGACGSVLVGISFPGNDIQGEGSRLLSGSVDACCAACAAHPQCGAWEYCNLAPPRMCGDKAAPIDCFLKVEVPEQGIVERTGRVATERVAGTPGAGCLPTYPKTPPPPLLPPKPKPRPKPKKKPTRRISVCRRRGVAADGEAGAVTAAAAAVTESPYEAVLPELFTSRLELRCDSRIACSKYIVRPERVSSVGVHQAFAFEGVRPAVDAAAPAGVGGDTSQAQRVRIASDRAQLNHYFQSRGSRSDKEARFATVAIVRDTAACSRYSAPLRRRLGALQALCDAADGGGGACKAAGWRFDNVSVSALGDCQNHLGVDEATTAGATATDRPQARKKKERRHGHRRKKESKEVNGMGGTTAAAAAAENGASDFE